jgi:hypothetical protein
MFVISGSNLRRCPSMSCGPSTRRSTGFWPRGRTGGSPIDIGRLQRHVVAASMVSAEDQEDARHAYFAQRDLYGATIGEGGVLVANRSTHAAIKAAM